MHGKATQTTVGIVNKHFNPDVHSYMNKTNNGWGYYQADGKIGHGGSASTEYGIAYKNKSFVDGTLFVCMST